MIGVTLLHLKLGLRLALAMLAVMGVLSWTRSPAASTRVDWLRNTTALLLAVGVLLFSVAFLPPLLGMRVQPAIMLALELTAVAETCVAMIFMIAARALLRGVSEKRVLRSAIATVAAVIGLVVAVMVFK